MHSPSFLFIVAITFDVFADPRDERHAEAETLSAAMLGTMVVCYCVGPVQVHSMIEAVTSKTFLRAFLFPVQQP